MLLRTTTTKLTNNNNSGEKYIPVGNVKDMLGSTGMSDASQCEIVIDNTPSVLSSRPPPIQKGALRLISTPASLPGG